MISALVSYFNDIDMLSLQFRMGQFEFYDSVHIFDGPYEYTKATEFMHLNAPRLSDTDVGKNILASPRVHYHYQVWKDEEEKRIFAYQSINNDFSPKLIALHDSDEFIDIIPEKLVNFINSSYAVAGFNCQNLYLDGVYASTLYYAVENFEGLPVKNYLFKPDMISAAEHLDYLWLVGVKQEVPDKSKISNDPVSRGYHFTGMRSDDGQAQKYIFYGSLFNHNNPGLLSTQSAVLNKLVSNSVIHKDIALDIYLNSFPGFVRCPEINKDLILNKRIINTSLEPSLAEVVKAQSSLKPGTFLCASGISRYIFFHKKIASKIRISAKFEFQLKIWDCVYGKKISLRDSSPLIASEYEIDQLENPMCIGVLVAITYWSNIKTIDEIYIEFVEI